ncbi:MAG: phosphoserine phosphatase, partial [Oscillospiraceae bacterium]|nr:phosphoserine phosphatase [Oscillospiraceae bacterium]
MKKTRLQPKLLFGLIAMGVVLMLALTPTISAIYRDHMEKQYSKTAFDMASVAAGIIDGDRIAVYRNTLEKDEYYETVRRQLQLIRDTVGLKYFYVVIPEDVQFYIWDTGEEGDDGVCDLGDTDEFYGGGYELMHAAFAGDAEKTILITDNDVYGYLASAYVAITDSSGQPAALASVDISLDEINREIRSFVATLVIIAFGVLLLSSVLYYFYIRRILINPIKTLHGDTEKLVSERMDDLDSFANQVRTGDELEELGASFEYMTHELAAYIRNLSVVTSEKERIGAELNVATQIQADMLPRIFPAFPERKEFDLYASMDPAKEVG